MARHCTEPLRGGPWAGLRRAFLLAACVLATAMSGGALARAAPAVGRWMALEARIESGYFTQSTRSLQALDAQLSAGNGGQEELQSYYAGLLAYRLAELSRGSAQQAWQMAQRCVESLERSLALDADSAEALALQSACLALQSNLDPWRSPLAGALSLSRIDKAFRLAPDNPRVLLLGAVGAAERPKLFGGDPQQAFALLKRAVAAFEAARASPRGVPGWGAADAFMDLAQDYLTRGDAIAARDVLERALLVAPHFAQARRLMAEIVSG